MAHGPQYHASHGWEDFDSACIECQAFRGMQERKRLETAAPDLLAALKRLADRVDPATKGRDTGIRSFVEALNAARAAIARAKGE